MSPSTRRASEGLNSNSTSSQETFFLGGGGGGGCGVNFTYIEPNTDFEEVYCPFNVPATCKVHLWDGFT